MKVSDIFEGIQGATEAALAPFEALRETELSNWWMANIMTWMFILIFFVALAYWLKQLKIFNDDNEEDRSVVAHSFLAENLQE